MIAPWRVLAAAAACLLAACSSSVDSLGTDAPPVEEERGLSPLTGPANYPNPFHDVLGIPESDIENRIAAAFEQLFRGNPMTQAIYEPRGSDQATIRDILHNDERTEGIGLGMMFAVQRGEQEIVDRLWRYANATLRQSGGSGYFVSNCDTLDGATTPCVDPYGMQQMAMALVFAHGRFGSSGSVDYEADALALLDLMRAGDGTSGSTPLFDAETKIVFAEPKLTSASFTCSAYMMHAYYELWAQATGDSFFSDAAMAARAYYPVAAHPTTGLLPTRTDLSGMPYDGWEAFRHEAYRAPLNLVLDTIWIGADTWQTQEANRLIRFFNGQGIDQYGGVYALDGAVLDPMREPALVAANGAVAAIATEAARNAFIQAAWDLETPTGPNRYYTGLLHLFSLMVLGGQFRVY